MYDDCTIHTGHAVAASGYHRCNESVVIDVAVECDTAIRRSDDAEEHPAAFASRESQSVEEQTAKR